MNLPQQVSKNTYILSNKFNISGVGLFLISGVGLFLISGVGLFVMKSTFTVMIQIGLNDDAELMNLLRSWTLKTKCPE